MRQLSRLVWSEGMYLGPHHFQAQSRYFEDTVHFALSNLCFVPWGLAGYELDAEALHNGTLSVVHARGAFPDGVVFQMPDCDPLPEVRHIAELFSPIRPSMTAYLALAPHRPGAANCASDEAASPASRYLAEILTLADDTTGLDERPVQVGRKNIRLLLDSELSDDLVSLPVARIMRDTSGHFIFDERFIPPCLEIGASERLMRMLRRLTEILGEKSATLSQAKGGAQTPAGWSAQEVSNFWFLHCVNASLAPLRHLYTARRGHPEGLFLEMLRLGGALCTFGLETHPRTLPVYDHLRLQECFEALEQHIKFLLDTIIPPNCIPIPLTPAGDYFWTGPVADQRCLGRARWVLAIQSGIGEAELIMKTPQLVKVCSQGFIGKLVTRALPGLTLTHLQAPPAAVSPKLENQYFGVTRAGPCWDHIVQTRQVGVYVPGDIPNPEIQLLVVLEE
ncbi:MAG: type VI secretion system baseplate subunit TssK [Acidobacteria bacterium]|nr:type VI secretion system baseplate subunit TssK [Acidobacteriota bacterium]